MWLFFFLIIYIYIMSIVLYKNKVGEQRGVCDRCIIFLLSTMGLLLLLTCLRSLSTGNDTWSYYELFKYYTTGATMREYSEEGYYWMDSYVDIGWRFLSKAIGGVSYSYQLFISVIAAFFYGVTTRYLAKYSPNISASVMLFFLLFFHRYLNVLRQFTSIMIVLIGFDYLQKKQYIRFVICVLVAMLFHKFAFVSLILILFFEISLNNFRIISIIIFSAFMSASGGVFIIPRLIGYSGGYLSDQTGISTVFSFILNSIVFMMAEVLYPSPYFYRLQDKKIRKNLNFYRWINLIVLCLSILEIALPGVYRVIYFFSIFQIVGIPFVMAYSDRSRYFKVRCFLIIILTIIVYQTGILVFRPEWNTAFPYHFFWQEYA